jgi:hypothetical protein
MGLLVGAIGAILGLLKQILGLLIAFEENYLQITLSIPRKYHRIYRRMQT